MRFCFSVPNFPCFKKCYPISKLRYGNVEDFTYTVVMVDYRTARHLLVGEATGMIQYRATYCSTDGNVSQKPKDKILHARRRTVLYCKWVPK